VTPDNGIPLMAEPPSVSIPVPPTGFVPVKPDDLKGYRPIQSELAAVPDAIVELAQFPSWVSTFGLLAPPPDEVGQRLQIASDWTALLAQTNSWGSYVKSQTGMAWKDALEVVNSLKTPFQLASAANPSISRQYPALTRLLGAQTVVAKRAAATKKRTKAAAAATAAAAASSTSTTTAASPAADATAPVPARTVTVTG